MFSAEAANVFLSIPYFISELFANPLCPLRLSLILYDLISFNIAILRLIGIKNFNSRFSSGLFPQRMS